MLYKMLFKIYNAIFLHEMQVYWPKLVFRAKINDVGNLKTPLPLESADILNAWSPSLFMSSL